MTEKKGKAGAPGPLLQNKKAHFNYHILETVEAGIVLVGTEVKSLREHHGNIQEAYCRSRDGELLLYGATINEYAMGNRFNHDPERPRKLLLHKAEILRLRQKVERKGLTLVPLKLYLKRGKVKVELGLCEGKHTYDKKESLKNEAVRRDQEAALNSLKRR